MNEDEQPPAAPEESPEPQPVEPQAAEPLPASEPESAPAAPEAGTNLVRLAGGFYGILALFAFGYAIFGGSEGEPFLGLGVPSLPLAFAGLGVGLVIVGVVHVGLRVLGSVDRAAQEMARILGPVTGKEALYLALFSSVGEELVFRGALWPHLGMIGTTCLFGLVHVLPRKALWGYPLFAASVGLLLGLLRDASGSVIPAILAHFVINALNLAWLGANHDRLVGAAAPAGNPTDGSDA